MGQILKNAQIHRFRDSVAVSLPGKGETQYLSEAEARAIAKALYAVARSIRSESFVNSTNTTHVVKLSERESR